MVAIHTLSVVDFKHTMENNSLYDCNIEERPDVAVISIGNSVEDELPDDIFANGPSSHWFKKPHRNVLNIDFDDAVPTQSSTFPAEGSRCVLFNEEMAKAVADFVEANQDASVWIVHCSAGVSRSGAVSRWLKDRLEHKYSHKANNIDAHHASPNSHVLRLLDRQGL